MDAPVQKKEFAWQPLTPGGASRFARASVGRLWLVQLVVALVVAISVLWFLQRDWFPIVAKATRNLPEQAEIRRRELQWPDPVPTVLAENRFFAISVDPGHAGKARSPAQLSVELGQSGVRIFSLLGYLDVNYPAGWLVSLKHDEAIAWWGAWSPALLASAAAFVIGALLLLWTLLATIYVGPAWLAAFFANRELSVAGAWRLASAAQMPGGLFIAVVVVAYGLGWFDLVGLAIGLGSHFVIGWIYLTLAIARLPLNAEAQTLRQNPFAPPPADSTPA